MSERPTEQEILESDKLFWRGRMEDTALAHDYAVEKYHKIVTRLAELAMQEREK